MNTHRQHPRRHGIRRLGILLASLGLLAGFTACSSGSGDSDATERTGRSSPFLDDAEEPRHEPPADREGATGPDTDSTTDSQADGQAESAPSDSPPAGSTPSDSSPTDSSPGDSGRAPHNSAPGERRRTPPSERAVIQTGNVAVASEEVGDTRFDAKEIADRHSGEIAEEETGTRDGEITRVRMVIRVPQQEFDSLMTDLAELGELRSATRSSEDVSTQVVDTRSRVKSQERSIQRIQALLAEAEDLTEIISIESQLATRQADLDSLKSQLAWLEDQSSLSTVTLSLSAIDADEADEADEKDDEETGFLGGLARGWDGLAAVGTSVATGFGIVLPFLLALGVLIVPAWLLIRRRPRRERTATPPASA